ncbi:hypothetical protein L917_03900 [Phytophthora nicotianae]|uniref:Uncharacterized protein n=1 Tax=Phytophthora nicotianae TaxID=4792 RepID=W2LNY2_PHYNI|nr:hypothetical protein L917_03900 [Phytophthora nicotianae]
MRPSFPPSGFAIVTLKLGTSTFDALFSEARSCTYTPVFREVGGASDDPFRSQSRVIRLSSALKLVQKVINEDACTRDEKYQPTVFSFMHSRPGGEAQEPNQDYTAELRDQCGERFPGSVPASVIVSLENDTKLRVLRVVSNIQTSKKK